MNVNIKKAQIFHKIKNDLKCHERMNKSFFFLKYPTCLFMYDAKNKDTNYSQNEI